MIETKRCSLRLPALEDVADTLEFYLQNKEHLAPWDPRIPDGFYTLNYWEIKVHQWQEEYLKEKSVRFNIFLKETDQLIGMINFTRLERGIFQCCGVGYKIHVDFEGQGLMSESLTAATDYMFNELNFHRIEANYIPHNERSGRLLEKVGFEKEGLAKNYLEINGKWQDHVLTSKTNEKWREEV